MGNEGHNWNVNFHQNPTDSQGNKMDKTHRAWCEGDIAGLARGEVSGNYDPAERKRFDGENYSLLLRKLRSS